MKGCLITILVIIGLIVLMFVGCVGYVGYQGSKFADELGEGLTEVQATDEAFPFTAPEDGLLVEDRFETFLAIRAASIQTLDKTLAELRQIEGQEPDGFFDAIETAFGAIKGMATAFQSVPKELARELRANEMGLSEFVWAAEVLHGTLAGADRSGDPRAAELIDDFEDYFKDDGGRGAVHTDPQFDYGQVRHDLERRYTDFLPANLELILSHAQRIREPDSQVMVDVFFLGESGRPLTESGE